MNDFYRTKRLPPYVFAVVDALKAEVRATGADLIDFGMGNPDQPTPQHIVDRMVAEAQIGKNHRYSESAGIAPLRQAICNWYGRRYDVDLCPESEAIVTLGAKEGLAHLAFAIMGPDDVALVPNPAYPIHAYSMILADAKVHYIPMTEGEDFIESLAKAVKTHRPKCVILNFPSNPTAMTVDLPFFADVVEMARQENFIIIHDLAYADIIFNKEMAPSILQIPGAKEVAVEAFSLSKSYNMAGWRLGFMCGNPELVGALRRIKSYLDYGLFTPLQLGAVEALEGPQDCVADIRNLYRSRRDTLCKAINQAGWQVDTPEATMFLWAKIPDAVKSMGSIEFSKRLLEETHVAVAPGIGFGEYGDSHVRFSFIEDEARCIEAGKRMANFIKDIT